MGFYDSHVERGIEFYSEENFDAATAAFKKALEGTVPDGDVRAKCWLGRICRKLEKWDEALEYVRSAVETNKEDSDACGQLALLLARNGQCDEECSELAQRSIQNNADNGEGYIALWKVHGNKKEYPEAIEALKKGIRRGADFSAQEAFDIIQEWAQLYCDESVFDKAYELTLNSVDFFNTFDFIILHARLADYADKPREAVTYYKKALAYVRPGQLRTEILESIAAIAE